MSEYFPVMVRVVASVTVYVLLPCVNTVGEGHTVVKMSVVKVVYSIGFSGAGVAWMGVTVFVRIATTALVGAGKFRVEDTVTMVLIHVGSKMVVVKVSNVAIVLDEKHVLILTGTSTTVYTVHTSVDGSSRPKSCEPSTTAGSPNRTKSIAKTKSDWRCEE